MTEYLYDGIGNLVHVTDAMGQSTQYVYNALDRLTREILPDPDALTESNGPNGRPTTFYDYDVAGRLRMLTDPMT